MIFLYIKEFAKVKGGKRLPKGHSYSGSKTEYPYLRVTDFENYTINSSDLKYLKDDTQLAIKRYIISKDDVYISIAGTIGRVGYIPKTLDGANLTENAAKITEIKGFEVKYLVYFLSSIGAKNQISLNTKATSQPKLALYRIESISVPLAPLPEQRAIVAKTEQLFSELDNGIANLKTAKDKLKIYRQAVLKKAFEGELTKEWRKKQTDLPSADELLKQVKEERQKHYENQLQEWEQAVTEWETNGKKGKKPTKPRKQKELAELSHDDLPILPNSMAWVQLGEVVWSVKDGPHYSPKYTEQGIPFISGGNIRPTGVDFSNTKFISEELHKELSVRCQPEINDILYTKGGTTGIARVNTYNVDFNVWVHVAVLKPITMIVPFYLQYALNSTHCYKQSQKYTHGVGNQDLGLTRMVFISLPICSNKEQTQIVKEIETRFSVCDNAIKNIDEALEKSEALRQSILKKAFEGKLLSDAALQACRKEPDWEPAEKLLERIKKEKK